MQKIRKWASAVLVVLLMLTLTLPAAATSQEEITPYVQRMIQYYLHYQERAEEEIGTLLEHIRTIDPEEGALWEKIMADWSRCNSQMTVSRDVLPDGLAQDDSLCIVVLGFGLREDGSMKEELVDRLVVALASALKYPNAYVAVTGGETSGVAGISEAGQMAAWLQERGISQNRLIVENRSLSTTENALKTYSILVSSYPQVSSIALVSSDYHIPWGCAMFTTVANRAADRGEKVIELVGSAANTTTNASDTLYSQAWGISVIMDIPFDGSAVPAMYWEEETQPSVTQAAAAEEPIREDRSWMVFPAAMILLAAVILFIPTKRKEKDQSK